MLAAMIGGLITFFVGVPGSHVYHQTPSYVCEPAVWTDPAHLEENDTLFKGTVQVDCLFETLSGGGYPQLMAYLQQEVETNATTIHAGPEETIYKGLPGIYYDVTNDFESEGEETLTARGDTYIATDNTVRFLQDFFSKKVSGEGNAKYVKKMDMGYEINTTEDQFVYTIRITSTNHVKKPFLVPSGLFLDGAKNRIEKELVDSQQKLLTGIANNL